LLQAVLTFLSSTFKHQAVDGTGENAMLLFQYVVDIEHTCLALSRAG
jgi:hypothetical protein